jgi:hypothetical protein
MISKTKDTDITSRILATKQVRSSWIEDVEGYLYESVDGSIIANPDALSLRFKLKETSADGGGDFEVVIRRVDESFVLKSDCPGMENKSFPLTVYTAPDDLLLYAEDSYNRIYFHLS